MAALVGRLVGLGAGHCCHLAMPTMVVDSLGDGCVGWAGSMALGSIL